ncbi:hypothetical protein [Desulfoscipio gibsoniae]|uniref:hypothetical protein n=1 Tax=Desulfoscipio gibsoniae TaxID=102134 RepID=UPI000232BBB8|nr:hypothetical protein [Desulfoscipio gibsoniae]
MSHHERRLFRQCGQWLTTAGSITYMGADINKAEALKLGYDSKDMIGKHFSEVIAGRITPILKKIDSNNSGTKKWMHESDWIGRSP